jgi:hypothetical protein
VKNPSTTPAYPRSQTFFTASHLEAAGQLVHSGFRWEASLSRFWSAHQNQLTPLPLNPTPGSTIVAPPRVHLNGREMICGWESDAIGKASVSIGLGSIGLGGGISAAARK